MAKFGLPEIKFTCSREAELEWRQARLEKVLDHFTLVFGITADQAKLLIEHMHDQKGRLLVTWHHDPTKKQIDAMDLCWRMNGEMDSEHNTSGATMVVDFAF